MSEPKQTPAELVLWRISEVERELRTLYQLVHDEYFTKDQMRAQYESRMERSRMFREWPLIVFGGIVALSSIGTLIIQVVK